MVNPKTPKRTLVPIEFQRSSSPPSPLAPNPSVSESAVPNYADDDQFPELGSPPPPTVGNVEIPGSVEFPELPTPTTPPSPAPTPTPTTPTSTRVLRPRKAKVAFASPAAPKSTRKENPAFKAGGQRPARRQHGCSGRGHPRRQPPRHMEKGEDKETEEFHGCSGGNQAPVPSVAKDAEKQQFHAPVVTRRVKSPKKPSPEVRTETKVVEKKVEKEVAEAEAEDVEMEDVGNDDQHSAGEEVAGPSCADRNSFEHHQGKMTEEVQFDILVESGGVDESTFPNACHEVGCARRFVERRDKDAHRKLMHQMHMNITFSGGGRVRLVRAEGQPWRCPCCDKTGRYSSMYGHFKTHSFAVFSERLQLQPALGKVLAQGEYAAVAAPVELPMSFAPVAAVAGPKRRSRWAVPVLGNRQRLYSVCRSL
ncbi:hypothetical protein EDC01DRAFT_753470 [Geopyxis carbonaria]|nr:hypothetical protein EDC01DRAFT_753470 [Geopyxis carbonaria]